MNKSRVLFLCVHNSARSQMAEAFLKRYCGACFDVESAGLEPSTINPIVVDVMKELGMDLSANGTQDVFDLFKSGRRFNYVVTVCDEAAERCPIFPATKVLHWRFPDPSRFEGSYAEKLAQTREVRDAIKHQIELWCEELMATVEGCACELESA